MTNHIVKPIPTDPETYRITREIDQNAHLTDYDVERGLGFSTVVTVDLPEGLETADQLAEAISAALTKPDQHAVIVRAYGPPFDDVVLDAILDGYLACAAWCGVTANVEGDSVEVDADQFDPEAKAEARTDIVDFVQGNPADVREYLDQRAPADLGGDFFLSRNRHGTGFWDRGLGALGNRLHEAATVYGETNYWLRQDDPVVVSG